MQCLLHLDLSLLHAAILLYNSAHGLPYGRLRRLGGFRLERGLFADELADLSTGLGVGGLEILQLEKDRYKVSIVHKPKYENLAS